MIIYSADKQQFLQDQLQGSLIRHLDDVLAQRYRRVGARERMAWKNSLQYMYMVINDADIPDDCGVAIEYMIPTSAKRIDFIITGFAEDETGTAIIIELKQWSEAKAVASQDAIVQTALGGGLINVPHPSYQAWSYASLLDNFNSSVQDRKIHLHPCAYLHNYRIMPNDPLTSSYYQDILQKAPLFGQQDALNLRDFIKSYVKKGDNKKVLYDIENGKIRPSKSLQDRLASMLDGNTEFIMVDDQKIVYEEAISMAEKSRQDQKKRVMIVEGGPGTGKSVVSINLLVELIRRGMNCQYVTKNSAPRNVYKTKLKGTRKIKDIDILFKSSGTYVNSEPNEIDVLIVDESHRLNEKSGLFFKGENQIKEIINASRCSIFFIDEDQTVTIKDIGSVAEINNFAEILDAQVSYNQLESQFRCNGSDGYLAWLDDVLEIRETANIFLDMDFDFDVLESPQQVLDWVKDKNKENNKSRIMAGYCWEWPKEKRTSPDYHDIEIPEHQFSMSWNLDQDIWAIEDDSVTEAGCIHTSQGLEFDYIGVIIGLDLRYENGQIVTDHTARASSDRSLYGIKKMMKEDPERAWNLKDRVIKNTYRTLLTRGMRGCRVFCCDPALGISEDKNERSGYQFQLLT